MRNKRLDMPVWFEKCEMFLFVSVFCISHKRVRLQIHGKKKIANCGSKDCESDLSKFAIFNSAIFLSTIISSLKVSESLSLN